MAVSTVSQAPMPFSPDPEHCLYSNVAASRPSSPQGDKEHPPIVTSNAGQQTRGVSSLIDVSHRQRYIFPIANTTSPVSMEMSEEPESSPWQTVKRWQSCSLDSVELTPKKTGPRGRAPKKKIPAAIMEPSNVGQAAAEETQLEATQHQQETSAESQQEQLSCPKGKGRDPCEWGDIYLNKQEMDTALQQAALKSYKEHGQWNRNNPIRTGNCPNNIQGLLSLSL